MSNLIYERSIFDQESSGDIAFEWRKLGSIAIEEALREEESMEETIIPEAEEEIIATLKDRPEGVILLACGDDRGMHQASVNFLKSEGLPANEPYARYFGGGLGLTRIALVAVAAQHGGARLRKLIAGRDFMTINQELAERAGNAAGMLPTAHSSERSENNKSKLNHASTEPIACAYAINLGGVTYLAGHEKVVRNQSAAEFKGLFGPSVNSENIDVIVDANKSVAWYALGEDPRNFSVSREDLLKRNIPTMILKGNHAPSMDTFVLANFSRDKLTDPNLAESRGHKFYGADLTQVAEAIILSLPEHELNPEIIFAAMLQDIAATRTALAAHDGPANPSRIALVKYGDPEEALDYLRSL